MRQIVADTILVVLTSAYARWLDENKILEPDGTWLEVAIGVAICLAHAAISGRLDRGTWRSYELAVWRSFAVGSMPIIVGEIDQARRRRRDTQRYLQQRQ